MRTGHLNEYFEDPEGDSLEYVIKSWGSFTGYVKDDVLVITDANADIRIWVTDVQERTSYFEFEAIVFGGPQGMTADSDDSNSGSGSNG